MKSFICVTSLNPKNNLLNDMAAKADSHDWSLVVAGDAHSGEPNVGKGLYLSLKDQLDSGFDYPRIAPLRNYCRKNIAYLEAMRRGAELIVETDDDSVLYEDFFENYKRKFEVRLSSPAESWVNIYRYFTEELIWPRGFNLEFIKNSLIPYNHLGVANLDCPVQNSLVDNDPDVDAIYRLILKLPFNFEHKKRKVATAWHLWCPFNTQNTAFFKEVFPLMYQPATPKFREADIIRSFVIQRILWENQWHVCFSSPTLKQERNPHDYLEDLKQETELYKSVGAFCRDLEQIDIKKGAEFFKQNMIFCYKAAEKYGFVRPLEFSLIEAWFDDLETIK